MARLHHLCHHLELLFLFIGCVSGLIIEQGNCDPDGPQRAAIGIDLGSTYCRVGIWSYKNGIEIIPNDRGNLMTPSWISFTHNQTFIGEDAKDRAVDYPESTFSFDVQKFRAKRFDELEVQSAMKKVVPYKIVNKDGKPYIEVKIMEGEHKLFSPEEITSLFLTKMKKIAENFLGKEIELAMITIPGIYYNDVDQTTWDVQLKATRDAGNMAGLNNKQIFIQSEAEAAAMAYHMDVEAAEMNILVFNLGGSTFEATIFYVQYYEFEKRAISTDTHLGGEDFDQRVTEYFTTIIKNKYGKDISNHIKALAKLKNECERAKIALSSQNQVQLEIKSLVNGVDFSEPLTRAQFEELNMDLFNKTIELVKKAVKDSGLKKDQIDEIILSGGSTKIPKVKQLLMDYFDGKEANKGFEPDEVVVSGASRRVASIFLDCDIPEISHYPISSLYPWRISLPVGIKTSGGVFKKVAYGPYFFPFKKSKNFTTKEANQTRISIQIYEGKGNFTTDCRFLGKLELTGIPPAPRGSPQINIAFRIDYLRYINTKQSRLQFLRYINVKAELKGTGISEQITIIRNALEDLSEDQEAIDHTQQHMALPGPPYSGGTGLLT